MIKEIRNRLVSLCGLIELPAPLGASHAFKSKTECSFAPDDLPAFIVRSAGGTHQRNSTNGSRRTRDFIISLYVSAIPDESYQEDDDAWDLVDDCIDPVLDYFAAKPSLALNFDHLVMSAEIDRDGGRTTLDGRGRESKYRGVRFRLQATYQRRVEQDDE